MKTIVQDYGPIYGEVVNGTVQGRPNGSVYVPSSNTISISTSGTKIFRDSSGHLIVQAYGLDFVAQAQDLASYVQTNVFTDASCTTPFATGRNRPAGQFNGNAYYIADGPTDPVTGTKYYLRAQLMNNSVAVATSNVLEVEGL